MEYLELTVPVLVTTIAILLAWFLVKKKQNALVIAEESEIKDKLLKEVEEEEDEEFDFMEARERLAAFLFDSSDLESFDDEPGHHNTPNIQTLYKKSRLKIQKLEKNMTTDELEKERNTKRKQLENIFKMMEESKEKFGVETFQELEDQMQLYSK